MTSTNDKKIFSGIHISTVETRNNKEIKFVSRKDIKVYKADELVEVDENTEALAQNVAKEYRGIFEETYNKGLSEQQLRFSYDCSKILDGRFKHNKPVLVSAKAGFGKSTFIRTFLEEKIKFLKKDNPKWGAIIVSDRIKDLKELQEYFQDSYGYYREYTVKDDEGNIHLVQVPFIYILESWNKDICLDKEITEYDESNCNQTNCKHYERCKISKQFIQQAYSPIVAMSNIRLNSYLDAGRIKNFLKWKMYNGTEIKRKVMIIDEKPKLENNDEIDLDIIREMISNLNLIQESNSDISKVKKLLERELLQVQQRLSQLEIENNEYRNTIVFTDDKTVFSDEFKEFWNTYYKFKHRYKIKTIETLLSKGGLWCKTNGRRYFKLIEYINLDWSNDINTVIFDATSESDPSYIEVFNYLDINDYKDYRHLHFNIVSENLSKSALKEHPNRLNAVIDWIKRDIANKGKTYIVTYMEYARRLIDDLKGIENIILDEKDGNKIVPYFGNTKGKNKWRECNYMVLLGWNRYPSDEYLSSFLSVNFQFNNVRENYFNDSEKQEKIRDFLPEYLKNINGVFEESSIEFHKLCKIMVELEQEIFRSKVRDFGCDDDVYIYIFKPDDKLIQMIEQRFYGCQFHNTNIPELNIEKISSRKNNSENRELALYQWLINWDGTPKVIKELKQELNISDDYWKDLRKKPLIQEIWNGRNITIKRQGQVYFITDN